MTDPTSHDSPSEIDDGRGSLPPPDFGITFADVWRALGRAARGEAERCGGLGCPRLATRRTDDDRARYDLACDTHADGDGFHWYDLQQARVVRLSAAALASEGR